MANMQTSMQIVEMKISGLGPGRASRGVHSALYCIRGVAQVRVVTDERRVFVTYNALRVSPHQFETAVRVMGCEVESWVVRTPDAPLTDRVADAMTPVAPRSIK